MSDLPPTDLTELANFPSRVIRPTLMLQRVHRAEFDPEFYSIGEDYRFSPSDGHETEFGTCYLAATEMGAFLETLGRFRPLPRDLIDERSLSRIRLAKAVRVADLTQRRVAGEFGIFGDLSAGEDYDTPRAWACALFAAGFQGIWYRARHDPAFEEESLALFGSPGIPGEGLEQLAVGDTTAIPDLLVVRSGEEFGFKIMPRTAII